MINLEDVDLKNVDQPLGTHMVQLFSNPGYSPDKLKQESEDGNQTPSDYCNVQ